MLFEEADCIFLHLQGKDRLGHMNGKGFKVSTCYEGWNEQRELVGKVISAGFEDGKTFRKLREATIYKSIILKRENCVCLMETELAG